jgi:hypothetical protein
VFFFCGYLTFDEALFPKNECEVSFVSRRLFPFRLPLLLSSLPFEGCLGSRILPFKRKDWKSKSSQKQKKERKTPEPIRLVFLSRKYTLLLTYFIRTKLYYVALLATLRIPAPTQLKNTVPLSGSGWMLKVTPKNARMVLKHCMLLGVSWPKRTRHIWSGEHANKVKTKAWWEESQTPPRWISETSASAHSRP